MTRILIPTDLSDNAMHAGEFAVQLFGRTDATYILLHAYVDPGLSETMAPAFSHELFTSSKDGLKEFTQRFVERTGAEHVEHEVVYGTLPSAVNAAVEHTGAQVVAMGKRGQSGTAFFGSNTIAMIGHCRVPVLVVPEIATVKKVQRILLANDHAEVLARDLELLRDIALANNAEVLIGHVRLGVAMTEPHWSDGLYEMALKGVRYSFHSAHGTDIVDGLDRSVHRNKVDMITVLHRHIGLLGRLLHPSTAKDVARGTELPLLVLEDTVD